MQEKEKKKIITKNSRSTLSVSNFEKWAWVKYKLIWGEDVMMSFKEEIQ